MSFHTIEPAKARLNRSELAVPGSNVQMIEKAAKSSADVVFLDMEDAVAPSDKEQARKNIIEALNDIDWVRRQCQLGSMDWTLTTCIEILLMLLNKLDQG